MLTLFHHGPYLRAATDTCSYPCVKPVWSAPLSHPGKYLALLDTSDNEVAFIPDLSVLSAESRSALDEELRRRYLTATVTRVLTVEPQHGPVYFTADTNRGRTSFLVQHLQDNAIWFSDSHVLLIDTDSNRFEIRLDQLDVRSRAMLHAIL